MWGIRSINEVISKRDEIAVEAKRVLQKELDDAESGVDIVTIEMKKTNVPGPVQPSFNEVNQATQEKEQTIYQAKEDYNKAIPAARGEADRTIKAAEGYALDRINRAQGDSTRFIAFYNEYAKAKDVTKRRLYLETLKDLFPKLGKKYIIDSDQKNLLPLLNLGSTRRCYQMKSKGILIIIAAVIVILVYNGAYIVDETEQVIITQFGRIVGSPKVNPGLKFKLPFFQKANFFPKNLLAWDGDPGQIPTLDKTFIWVDAFARWKIVEPVSFFQTVNNRFNALGKLNDIIDPAVRNFITSHSLIEAVRNTNREMDTLEVGLDDREQQTNLRH